MKRSYAAILLALATALALAACGDDSAPYGSAGGGGYYAGCSQYTTCGACTPVQGCGWCFNSTGGACATDPNECARASHFTWTWDPAGCPDLDASVAPLDGGAISHDAKASVDGGYSGE